ncbi:MAG: nitrile hydratase subunit beta [Alphaproteobacteria bacterium]|mgnify:CR=1 FL=1|jgi:nitrile hydratase|nr:nitrile hydratase subunit beta [Alphaproteobacteria bacterium]
MPRVTRDLVRRSYQRGGAVRIDAEVAPRFRPGDHIVARNINPPGHTRLPRYIRGKEGRIERDHGVFHLPDARAHGEADRPQHIYSVRFAATALWGPGASERDSLYIDLWDDYMDAAEDGASS